ncbi:MAG: hypothetical protein ACTSVV_07810 [Promethearchaeota archaeon]
MTNIHKKLEELINSLAISPEYETFYKERVQLLFDQIRFSNYNSSLFLQSYYFGGSFDRNTFIKNKFDIDIYFIFNENTYLSNSFYHNFSYFETRITGELLQNTLYEAFLNVHYYNHFSNENSFQLFFLREPPYRHAIPIQLRGQGWKLNLDCVPAVRRDENDNLIIPYFTDDIKIVNPLLEIKALSKLNKKHNGKITKFIRLIKYWNYLHGHPFKSYILERIIQAVFHDKNINTWDKAVKTFFPTAIHVIRNNIKLNDRVYPYKSILEDFYENEIDKMLEILREAAKLAQKEDFKRLFRLSGGW